MKLSKLVEHLSGVLERHGDMDCYTNGMHGIGEVEHLELDNVSIGSANLQFDTDHMGIDDSDTVCHIGGY